MNADVTPMNADARRERLDQVSRAIIGAAQRVGLRLGHGFLLVENAVIVEIKAVTGLHAVHRQQCLNYLRATGHHVCLLLDSGQPRLEVRRLVWKF